MNAENKWLLADCREPLDDEWSDFPTKTVENETDLSQELARLRTEEPGIFFLINANNDALRLGLGDVPFGIVECRIPSSPHDREYACPQIASEHTPIEFCNEGLGEPFWPPNLIEMERVIEIAVFFVKEHRFPEDINWGPRYWGDSW